MQVKWNYDDDSPYCSFSIPKLNMEIYATSGGYTFVAHVDNQLKESRTFRQQKQAMQYAQEYVAVFLSEVFEQKGIK